MLRRLQRGVIAVHLQILLMDTCRLGHTVHGRLLTAIADCWFSRPRFFYAFDLSARDLPEDVHV